MEIKVNKEIRSYNESVFLGLSLRQTIYGILAVSASVGTFFLFQDRLNMEVISWLCILAAAPFGALGFIKYNGMPLERFILIWIQSNFLIAKTLIYRPQNIYLESAKPFLRSLTKRRKKLLAKNTEKSKPA